MSDTPPTDTGVSDLAREAAVQVAPVSDGDTPTFRRRQAYVTAIASDWKSASIKFPESSVPIDGVRFMYPSMPPAVGDTVWIDQNGPDNVISSAVGVPMGVIEDLDGRLPVPAGWLVCDGRSTAGYPINAYISNTPDLRDKFLVSSGSTYSVGQVGGEATHVLTVGELPAHQHTIPNHNHNLTGVGDHTHAQVVTAAVGGPGVRSDFAGDNASSAFPQGVNTGAAGAHNHSTQSDGGGGATSNTGGGAAMENRPPFYAVVRIIKAV